MEASESIAIDAITDRIEAALPRTVTHDLIEHTVREVWIELEKDAECTSFLPVLTERIARERLRTRPAATSRTLTPF